MPILLYQKRSREISKYSKCNHIYQERQIIFLRTIASTNKYRLISLFETFQGINVDNTIQMGSNICIQNTLEAELKSNPFDYVYGEDNLESHVPHDDIIICRTREIQPNIYECIDRLKISEKLYKDPTMKTDPVILRSLSSKDSEVKCTFERPYNFLADMNGAKGKKYKIIDFAECKSSNICIRDDVLQYFGVFLCFLSENPHLINQIILTDSNSYGIHVVKMNVGSKKEFIYIDDYILCCDRRPLFSQPIKGTYMWPCLLQKAWFKVKGSIAKKIEKVSPEDVFNAFLSYPMKSYLLKPKDQEYNLKLIKSLLYNLGSQSGCVVTTKKQPLHKIGISGRKHFYLLVCFNFEGKTYFYLRNPSLTPIDFRGSHRYISEQLSKKIKQLTGESKIPEGNFILQQDEFLEQTEQFFIIHYTKSSQIVSEEPITIDDRQEFFISTDLKNDGLVSICFSQQGNGTTDRQYSPLVYHVISINNEEIVSDQRNEEGCFGVRNTYLLENVCQTLKAGEYLIRIKKKNPIIPTKRMKKDTPSDKIILTAPFKVKFDYKQISLLKQKFYDFLREKGRKQLQKRGDIKKGKADFDHRSFWLGDLVVVYVEKTNNLKKTIRVEVQFAATKNLQCLSHQLKKEFTAIEPFQKDLLIVFQKIDLIEETTLGTYIIESF